MLPEVMLDVEYSPVGCRKQSCWMLRTVMMDVEYSHVGCNQHSHVKCKYNHVGWSHNILQEVEEKVMFF